MILMMLLMMVIIMMIIVLMIKVDDSRVVLPSGEGIEPSPYDPGDIGMLLSIL